MVGEQDLLIGTSDLRMCLTEDSVGIPQTYIMKIFALIIFDYYYLDYGICASDHAMTPHLQLGIICFGENDAVDAGDVEERLHVSLSRYMWNMRSIIGAFREPDIDLILITPTTVDSEQWPNRNSLRPSWETKRFACNSHLVVLFHINAIIHLPVRFSAFAVA